MAPQAPPSLTARGRRFLGEWLAVSAVAVALLAILTFSGAAARLDNMVYDALMRLAPAPASDGIVIVAIDEPSLAALGRWPWPRQRHAEFFAQMAKARPRAIAYDVIFAEPDPADADLAQAIHAAPATVLPFNLEIPGPDGIGALMREPVAPLAAAAAALGHVDIGFDPDGVVRRVYLFESDGRRTAPQLMLALKASLDHAEPAAPTMRPSAGLRRARETLIRFHGSAGAYRTVPFASVIRGEVPPEVFRDRIVLVGATANGLNDRYATPMLDMGGMSGVEIQANLLQALQALQARTVLSPLGPWGRLGVGLTALVLLLAGCRRLSPRATLGLTAALCAGLLALSAAGFFALGLWIAPASGLISLALVYPLWSWRRLEATSRYMLQELQRFRDDQDIWLDDPGPGGGDVVSRQLDLMDSAVGRMRHLRRFVADTVHSLPDPTLVTGLDGGVLLANAKAKVLFGELQGATWPDLIAGWRFTELDADGEAEGYSPGGAVYRIRTVTHRDEAGTDLYVITRLTDVTAVRAATEQRERMLALLTHDMRSPQASILALLKTTPAGEVSPALARQISAMAGRTLTLADNFVLLARAQAETYDLQQVSLSAALVEAIDELWAPSSLRGAAIEAQGVEEDCWVVGDRSLLTRALINLIDNAIKYSEGRPVVCTLAVRDGMAVCSIADSGKGMTEAELARIYQPFQRAGEHAAGGAGLGLALVRAVVQRHGGRIEHTSTVGAGTVATLALPLAEAQDS